MNKLIALFRRTPKPVHSCEICTSEGVDRRGNWDYCPKGHTYIGERADSNMTSAKVGMPAELLSHYR